MTRYAFAATAALLTAGFASAQPFQPSAGGFMNGFPGAFGGFPGAFGGGFGGQPNIMPNIFNPQNQPLSPYLNLLGGNGNLASRYYFGVRPGTTGAFGAGGIGAPFTAFGGYRPPFFPQLAMAPDPLDSREVGTGDVLPPAGHPVSFNNTMGFFPSPFGNRGGGGRPGLAGVGQTRPPARK